MTPAEYLANLEKDRIGRTLSFDDMTAYPKIEGALARTRELMPQINESIAAHGGCPGAFQH